MTTNRYVIIYEDGRSENVNEGWAYHDILDEVGTNMLHTVYHYKNYPKILIKNGKIVITSQLHDIAYQYVIHKRNMIEKAENELNKKFREPEGNFEL